MIEFQRFAQIVNPPMFGEKGHCHRSLAVVDGTVLITSISIPSTRESFHSTACPRPTWYNGILLEGR